MAITVNFINLHSDYEELQEFYIGYMGRKMLIQERRLTSRTYLNLLKKEHRWNIEVISSWNFRVAIFPNVFYKRTTSLWKSPRLSNSLGRRKPGQASVQAALASDALPLLLLLIIRGHHQNDLQIAMDILHQVAFKFIAMGKLVSFRCRSAGSSYTRVLYLSTP